MIIGFSRHGTGGGRGPVEYITSQERAGREVHPPQILRGSPDNTRLLIDSLEFEHRYTSGVLSFAPGETIARGAINSLCKDAKFCVLFLNLVICVCQNRAL